MQRTSTPIHHILQYSSLYLNNHELQPMNRPLVMRCFLVNTVTIKDGPLQHWHSCATACHFEIIWVGPLQNFLFTPNMTSVL